MLRECTLISKPKWTNAEESATDTASFVFINVDLLVFRFKFKNTDKIPNNAGLGAIEDAGVEGPSKGQAWFPLVAPIIPISSVA